ncbi:MAG: HAD-IC family P-type ATPase, partial [Pseudomonadota bacterium]
AGHQRDVDVGRARLNHAIAVLIITCPCALGLAAPAVQVVATGRLFRQGVLVKSGDALERLAEADAVVFDKTGTLTRGRLSLLQADALAADTLQSAARLARISRHPISRAIVAAAGPGPAADDAREVPGFGVEGEVDGVSARLGRRDWVTGDTGGDFRPAIPDAVTETWFATDGAPPVRLAFDDTLKVDAAETIAALSERGLEVEMLSGDRPEPAARIARQVGIARWRAPLSPQEKIARLDELKSAGAKVAMVGDGLNDAPSLAGAHASLSPGSAADASQAAADFVFQGDRLAPVVEAVDVARASRRRVLENFAFAALYNACAVPLAAAGYVTPLIAALAMSGSSLVVTLNALRLARR